MCSEASQIFVIMHYSNRQRSLQAASPGWIPFLKRSSPWGRRNVFGTAVKLNSGQGGEFGELFSLSCSKELGMGCPLSGATCQICRCPTGRDSCSSEFAGKSNFKILIYGGASSCYSLASCPLNLLLVSAVGFLEGQESWISSKSSGRVLNEKQRMN